MLAVLSIAGSDPSGGAGMQADIKTIAAHRLYAETAITALTAQNTTGVFDVEDVSPDFVARQIDAVFDDIRPAAVKIGMVSSVEIIEVIADRLEYWEARNIVVDPVMVATSGGRLIGEQAIDALRTRLIPMADLITPNLPEAEVLCGFPITTEREMERAAFFLTKLNGKAALIKGGHASSSANDVLVTDENRVVWLRGERIDTVNTHGTGCTLSSAIACNIALGYDRATAAQKAKMYVTGALLDGLDLGRGSGPLNHMWEYSEL